MKKFKEHNYNVAVKAPVIDVKSPESRHSYTPYSGTNGTASPKPDESVERPPETIVDPLKETEDNAFSATISNSSQWQDIDLNDPTAAWPNVTTKAFCCAGFYSGFRNQMMAFTGLVFNSLLQNVGQILLESISQKDTYGSNKKIPFEKLWDVPHWNSHYPSLPRLVHYNPVIHDQYDLENQYWYKLPNGTWTDRDGVVAYEKRERPIPSKQQHQFTRQYKRYVEGFTDWAVDGHRRPEEKLMISSAMRPHPKLREIIEQCQNSLNDGESGGNTEYMTLHARVEPDMQKHPVCRDKKVLNLTQIIGFIEEKWPEPPVRAVFMPINRQYLEKVGKDSVVNELKAGNKTDEINWIAVENLRVLNGLRDDGLWGGRVKVVEFGEKVLSGTEYSKKPSTTASLVNFFISIGAKIFIGTEVSSFSHDLLASRFFKDHMENYKYLPDGLHDWTPPGLVDPPGHLC
eukprot:CAMPEP_0195518750 /NCGR_PEP_ID=MMETSP0794_2-20130614/13589_1 /TAXON_ID=515487 /ORGANISM="Stephanopyxis turris, Strain CCMP 815" /LENGTH=458 /DNA_ID=CAMNT_0040647771 /DNA_START=301 /DNA_END=1677 /DNA_ORIENTATION=+